MRFLSRRDFFVGVLVCFFSLMGFLIYFFLDVKGKERFYQTAINTVVVSESDGSRCMEYKLKDNSIIYFLNPIGSKILIGDSIIKQKYTWNYEVYRKDTNGVFLFYRTYDGSTIN